MRPTRRKEQHRSSGKILQEKIRWILRQAEQQENAFPESFVEYKADDVVRLFTDSFHKRYDVECSAALHHNKKMTNYHIHLVFSERKMLEHPEVKIATRNMFYDEQGKHRRTKKEILDEQGNLRAGCSIIPKGEVYESHIFTKKDEWFKSDAFTREVKEMFTEIMILSILVYTFFSRMFDLMLPPVAKHSIVVA